MEIKKEMTSVGSTTKGDITMIDTTEEEKGTETGETGTKTHIETDTEVEINPMQIDITSTNNRMNTMTVDPGVWAEMNTRKRLRKSNNKKNIDPTLILIVTIIVILSHSSIKSMIMKKFLFNTTNDI